MYIMNMMNNKKKFGSEFEAYFNGDMDTAALESALRKYDIYLHKPFSYRGNYYVIVKITPSTVFMLDLLGGSIVGKSLRHCEDLLATVSSYSGNVLIKESILKALSQYISTNFSYKVVSDFTVKGEEIRCGNQLVKKEDDVLLSLDNIAITDLVTSFVKQLNRNGIYAGVGQVITRSSSWIPGPITTNTTVILGFKLEFGDCDIVVTSGVKSKSMDERMYSTTQKVHNIISTVPYTLKLLQLRNFLRKHSMNSVIVQVVSKDVGTYYIENNCLYLNTAVDPVEMQKYNSIKEVVNDHPYDPSVWGYT